MRKEVKIVILFAGIILTLFRDYWFLGIVLMLVGFYLLSDKNKD